MLKKFDDNQRCLLNYSRPLQLGRKSAYLDSPVCIGGIGGSGTRVLAQLLINLGFYLGTNINDSLDNFALPLNEVLENQIPNDARVSKIGRLLEDFESHMRRHGNWGWKVPGSFYWLHFIKAYFPRLKYLHLVRSGLDMAYSSNINQVYNWGDLYELPKSTPPSPNDALAYWLAANSRAESAMRETLVSDYLIVSFENLCRNPSGETKRICDFLELSYNKGVFQKASAFISRPSSIDRHSMFNYEIDLEPELVFEAKALYSRLTQ